MIASCQHGSHPLHTSIVDGNLFATLQTEAFSLALKLHEGPLKSNTVQLIEVTEELWRSQKYRDEARDAMNKLPRALKAIKAAEGGPTEC